MVHPGYERRGDWNVPYFGTRSKTYILEYSVPIERNGTRIGVVFSSYSREDLRELFNDLNFENSTGYFFVVSKGKVLYHPVPEHFNKDINNLTEDQDTELLVRVWTNIIASETPDNTSSTFFKAGSGQFLHHILKTEFDKNNTERRGLSEKSLLHHLYYILNLSIFRYFVNL